MDFTTVHTSFNPVDEDLVRARLEIANFHPVLKNENSALGTGGYTVGAGGILVQVPEDEASSAKSFLEDSTPVVGDDPNSTDESQA